MEKTVPVFKILGAKVHALTNEKLFEVVDFWIQQNLRKFIVLTGTHGIIEMQTDYGLKKINHKADLSTPDGMPEVWLGRLKGFELEKVYAPTIMLGLFERGVGKSYRHFFYGGKEGVADLLVEKMKNRFPDLNVVGTYCPPFRELTNEERETIIETINNSGAQIVWCGLGCPKQDKWMDTFSSHLNANVLIGVGAGFDFLSGEKPIAPKWIQQSGFEWLFRVFFEPKRLIKRYSIVIPKFLYFNFLDFLGLFKNNG